MASSAGPVTTETPITIKINHLGVTKKIKLPLRDLVASSLEEKLRNILSIPSSTECRFERYSDSAGVFVVLDRNNPSVYKQLFRAAKAKQKLKLRVVVPQPSPAASQQGPEAPPRSGPRPVTIEEVPETGHSDSAKPTKPSTTPVIVSSNMSSRAEDHQYPAIPGRFPVTSTTVDANWEQDVDAHLHATLQNMARNHELLERNIARLGASVAEMGRKAEFSTTKSPSPIPSSASSSTLDKTSTSAATEPAPAPQPIPVVKCTARAYPSPWEYPLFKEEEGESAKPSPTPEADGRSTSVSSCAFQAGFSVCCNSCERHIPDTHYHCSTCEEGDFDLCQDCVDLGITCYNPEHWLIKRYIKDGSIINSTTERVPAKPKSPRRAAVDKSAETLPKDETKAAGPSTEPVAKPSVNNARYYKLPERLARSVSSRSVASTAPVAVSTLAEILKPAVQFQIRTCNNCIRELPEAEFLHCLTCYDFDLCKECFAKNDHGHHPKHAFMPAVEGTEFDWSVTRRLSAGRDQRHNAVCDGCETFITGVRHKCLNCPDWDYCSGCVLNADFIHPGHRFIPIYEPLLESSAAKSAASPSVHVGIYCDGPHCINAGRSWAPIVGDRYKCAVCNNKDFCANCEASPANTHNKTHPLIKFRTPVRHVSVTTTGEHDNGRRMPVMGDRRPRMFSRATSTPAGAAESEAAGSSDIQLNKVQTVLDVKPTAAESSSVASSETQAELEAKPTDEASAEPAAELLGAMFQGDAVADGTVFPPNHVFEQTWTLRNTGSVAWPAGCCVRFVSGDYMGHVDPNHPAGIQELVSASESTICYEPLAPGAEFPFTVLLRTPSRLGKAISYWRLTTKGGIKFGDRLWCDVDVRPKEEEEVSSSKDAAPEEKDTREEEKASVPAEATSELVESSQMIFPKLDKESPVASIHEPESVPEPAAAELNQVNEQSEFEDWADDDSEDGFLTDEEYDILDASDEEFLEAQAKVQKK